MKWRIIPILILGFISGMIVQHNLQIKKNHETQKKNYEYGKTPDASLKIFGSAGKSFSKSQVKIRAENPVVEIAYADDNHL